MKTLVLGGYGNFGSRISKALASELGADLLIGGRDANKAGAFADSLARGAKSLGIDHTAPSFSQQIKRAGVGLVIHTAGPFQGHGYTLAQACAAAGTNYIDLADGRAFVSGFQAALDSTFQAAHCVAVTGASTVPALSSAVVEKLSQGWKHIDSIEICIAPAQTATRGLATLEGVLSYCGESIRVWSGGQWQTQIGWADPQIQHFVRMAPRWGALCDIPDLELFPAYFAVRDRVIFRAALEVSLTQHAFALIAALRRRGWIGNPKGMAASLLAVAKVFDPLGSALGGMVIRLSGQLATGQPVKRAWHIIADHGHGPEIPCMAAIILARKLHRGEIFAAGARACLGMLELAEFLPEFKKWEMETDEIDEVGA